MARLFRQPYTKPIPPGAEFITLKGKPHARFVGEDGRAVTAPLTRKGDRIRLLSAKWYVEYRDASGVVQRKPGYTDRKATEQLAAKLERHAARQAEGLLDPFEEHRKRPL